MWCEWRIRQEPTGQTSYKSQTIDSADGSADSKYLGSRISRRHLVGEHDKFPGRPLDNFQVLNRFDAGNEREAIITVWKRFAIQVDSLDLGTGNGKQFIRVIASERMKRIMSSNQPQQFLAPATHIEVVSAGWQRERSRDCTDNCLMNP